MAEEKVQLPTRDEFSAMGYAACMGYAARCGLRLLPLAVDAVTSEGSGWGQKSSKHLEATVRAQQAAITAGFADLQNGEVRIAAAARAANAYTAAAAAFRADPNRVTAPYLAAIYEGIAGAARAAMQAYGNERKSAAAAASAYAVAKAVVIAKTDMGDADAITAMKGDYVWLLQHADVPLQILRQPLWPAAQAPGRWSDLFGRWRDVMVKQGLSDLAKQVDAWMHGDFDPATMLSELEVWVVRESYLKSTLVGAQMPMATRMECRSSLEGDQPAEQDTLGRDKYAAVLADFIADKNTKPPLAISIEGAWGSGKSTFIKLLRKALGARAGKRGAVERVFFCQFNPWRYQNHEELWAAFALKFLEDLRGQLPWWKRWWCQLGYEWWVVDRWALVKSGLWLFASGLVAGLLALIAWEFGQRGWSWAALSQEMAKAEFLTWWGVKSSHAAAIYIVARVLYGLHKNMGARLSWRMKAQLNKPDYAPRIGFLDQFQKDFEKVVDSYVGKNERVVAFIDDLDRCDVPVAAELMRGINLMLNESDRVVFILGLDRAKVAAGLAVKHQDLLPYLYAQQLEGVKEGEVDQQLRRYGLEYGHEFIEKFIQLSFRLPAPDPGGMDGFLRKTLGIAETDTPQGAKRDDSAQPPANSAISEEAEAASSVPKAGQQTQTALSTSGSMMTSDASAPAEENRLVPDESEMMPALKHAARVFDGNPRRIKQLINLVRLQLRLSARLGYDLSAGQIAKWTAISLRWPRFVLEISGLSRTGRKGFFMRFRQEDSAGDSKVPDRWLADADLRKR